MESNDYYTGGADTRNKKAIAQKKGISDGMAKKSYNYKALIKIGYAEEARKKQHEEDHKRMLEEQEKHAEDPTPTKKSRRKEKKPAKVGSRKPKATERRRW
jgi:hypothetical protein